MSNHVCQELMEEIFQRLPSKSLVRFRSLSKSWNSRITSPDFIRMYTLQSVKNSSYKVLIREMEIYRIDNYGLHSKDRLFMSQGTKFTDISTVEFPCNYPKIVGSCKGVLCLVESESNMNKIILWNPSIRSKKIIIPDHPSFLDKFEKVHVAVGFGFDHVSDDYKIVRISYKKNNTNTMVYSMKTNSWYPIDQPPPRFQKIKSGACFVKGALHWVAKVYSEYYVMTFNLSTDTFGEIRLPKPRWKTKNPTIINGCLAVMSCPIDYDCRIWMMKEYNNASSWNVLFTFETDRIDDGKPKGVLQLPTCGDFFLINTYIKGLVVYNPVTQYCSASLKHSFHEYYMETCLESLELLDKSDMFIKTN